MIAIWTILPVAYRKAKVRLQKGGEWDRRTHFLQIQREAKVSTPKRTQLGTYSLEVTEGGIYQDMESELEKHTHILVRAKGEWSGLRKKGLRISRNTHFLERSEVRTGENMESKQASKGHSPPREGRGWDW